MTVKPNKHWTAAETIRLDAESVQIDQRTDNIVEINVRRPDGGTTTIAVMKEIGGLTLAIVGQTQPDPTPATEETP